MKTKLLLLCLFLVSVLLVSGCAGLASGTGDNQIAVDNLTAADNETVTVEPITPAAPETTPSTPETPSWNSIPSVTGPVEPGNFPSNLEYLTEQEKAEVIRIASEASGRSIDPASVKFMWFGRASGTGMIVDYDAVEKGIPDVTGAREMTFYPAIAFLTPAGWMTIVVDLQTEKALEVRGPVPPRTGPAINPNLN